MSLEQLQELKAETVPTYVYNFWSDMANLPKK